MAMTTGAVEPATIINLDTREVIKCMFRPKEYTATKRNTWNRGRRIGRDAPDVTFSGGDPINLQMELLFDTYEAHSEFGNSAGEDVRNYTNPIWKLMLIGSSPSRNARTNRGQPPKVEFRWGSTWSFKAVLTNISQKFTLFKSDGTPVRATLTVAFQQVEQQDEFPFQNPTSGGVPGHRVHVVQEGETIDGIAFEEYGDPARWRYLAEANNVDDPMHLRIGQPLRVPPPA